MKDNDGVYYKKRVFFFEQESAFNYLNSKESCLQGNKLLLECKNYEVVMFHSMIHFYVYVSFF